MQAKQLVDAIRNATGEEWKKLTVDEVNHDIYEKVLGNWDNVAKPLDGMGRFETITARIGAIQGTEQIDISKKAVLILCADNGIVEEGVSQSGQEVTLAVVKNMAEKRSSVGRMAAKLGADTIPIDIGVNSSETIAGVWDYKIRCGTRNFRKEPAMTEQETIQAIVTGIRIVSECRDRGYQILATGEMGIGNTTTSSAVTAALLDCKAAEVTGRGAGLGDERLLHKQRVIDEAIEAYQLRGADALSVLATVGGLDLAGLAGVCIGGALFHIPIVLDGVISMAAALAAERIVPGTREYLIASHKGKEPAVERLTQALGLEPVIDGRMALGEGTGAVMMLSLLDLALTVYQDRTTFSDIRIGQYERF
ncbi:MAG: nicotinate-nucleotide--dimethylbenzimidazole phosphoribosyltransferase [Lachnospiraceae bacterium]|nr:nicotinate-nucleotide--dimethylbenzimidazole phosphoribosyltransferase [Lachnospiraceae bacterium]